ncbi:HlyD family type I secretion periplasmic adaptor subunit [Rhodopseudomonas sp. HC1]|uniref:HlyD family type I secretion periplasmic adaptor subunit n=1 Tax=Rhodopseudomonas infernalis TaxID=2897386 RepID=UPI001EE8BFB7|nr:HlyD family type I secretion periplasmic adaptor subunit [Rhodopseudomonas infernalis]MCG6205218.1 HlyD family type I secretion periplasmic adaptor subunit [Rhodopseudomonas infernalis]
MSRSRSAAAVTVRQFQSETDAIREAPEPLLARATLWVLFSLLVATIAILFLTSLDRVVSSAGGKIVPVDQSISVVQALNPSIIKSINVREGEEVEGGQLLATLDSTFTSADLLQFKKQVASLQAQLIRDKAELSGAPLEFPHQKDPEFAAYASVQRALYDQRNAQYAAQVASFDSKIAQMQATINKLRNEDQRYTQRDDVLKKIEDMRSSLAESGSGSKLNLYLSQDARIEIQRQIDFTHNSLIESENQLKSIEADRRAFIEQWRSKLSEDLVNTQSLLDAANASYDKALRNQDLVRLTADEASVVLTLAKLSVGSVLKQGDALITLMPLRTKLDAEIRIVSRDIGFVRPGDSCTMKIEAFNFAEHGTAQGKVRWISGGAFTTDDNGQPVDAYYKARCSVDATNFRNVPSNFKLIPGMTLTADINVGTRSVAMYVIGDMMKGLGQAMREPQ